MWGVPRPSITPGDAFDAGTSSRRAKAIDYPGERPNALAAATKFASAVTGGGVHNLQGASFQPSVVTRKEMLKVYDRLLRGRARRIYDQILLAAPDGRCPLCGSRMVRTLDHYLPKSEFPLLCAAPDNLVPCCSDCNTEKKQASPRSVSDVFVHPYFDRVDADRWLYASVVPGSPAAVFFSVSAPATWSPDLAGRVESHFRRLKLGNLYCALAAEELSNIRGVLARDFSRGGERAVAITLTEQSASRSHHRTNSWQSAMYEALASDAWFRGGGFAA
jgi:hypothetical protein